MADLLNVEHLSVSFFTPAGEAQAVRDVSFSLKAGEVLAIVGESGCGKSVLCKSILRLLPQTAKIKSGKIIVDGTDITAYREREMTALRGSLFSMVFQDPMTALDPTMTIGAQIAEAVLAHRPKLEKSAVRARVIELLELVGIDHAQERMALYPHSFSGGMRQRVVLAIALAGDPRILFADEPTTALDVTIQAQIMELIVRLNEQLNMGVMLITHDLAVVAQTCSRVIVMYLGQIVEEADVLTLFDHPCHPYTEGLMRSIPRMEGDRTKPLYMIPGTVPLLSQIPTGCRFAPRCAYATERCRQETPQLTPVSDKQSVRCFRAAELAQKEATAQ